MQYSPLLPPVGVWCNIGDLICHPGYVPIDFGENTGARPCRSRIEQSTQPRPATHELTIITLLGGGVALFLRYYLCHYALANVLIWALAGGLFVYISTSNYIYTVKQIPPMGANITIVGIVDSIQNVNIPSDNFDFIIKEWRGQPETSIREMKVRLYWDKANTLKQGEVLQLQPLLKTPLIVT